MAVSYLPSIGLAALGLVLLAALLIKTIRTLRGFSRAVSMVSTDIRQDTGLLRARTAALRVAVEERRGEWTPVGSTLTENKEAGR